MATFFNRATLTYNDNVINSNIVTGEILEVVTATKTALSGEYRPDETVSYAVSITNAGTSPYTDLTVTDDLGAYAFGDSTLVPLTYIDGSVRLFINGVLQDAPTVSAGPPLTVSGLTIPANSNATLIYSARANEFAPYDAEGTITKEVK